MQTRSQPLPLVLLAGRKARDGVHVVFLRVVGAVVCDVGYPHVSACFLCCILPDAEPLLHLFHNSAMAETSCCLDFLGLAAIS